MKYTKGLEAFAKKNKGPMNTHKKVNALKKVRDRDLIHIQNDTSLNLFQRSDAEKEVNRVFDLIMKGEFVE